MEIIIKDVSYRIGLISVRDQFHLIRKLTPAVTAIIPLFKKEEGMMDSDVESLTPFANIIAGMTQDDADYCLFSLLRCVSRKEQHGLGFGSIASHETYTMHYADISLMDMIKIAFESLKFNFKDFFLDLQSSFPGNT